MKSQLILLLLITSCVSNEKMQSQDEKIPETSNFEIYNDVVSKMMYFPYRNPFDTSRALYGVSSDKLKNEYPEQYQVLKDMIDKDYFGLNFVDFSDTIWTRFDSVHIDCLNEIDVEMPEYKELTKKLIKIGSESSDSLINANLLKENFNNDSTVQRNFVKYYLSHAVVENQKAIFVAKCKAEKHYGNKKEVRFYDSYLLVYFLKYDSSLNKWYIYNARECMSGNMGIFEF